MAVEVSEVHAVHARQPEGLKSGIKNPKYVEDWHLFSSKVEVNNPNFDSYVPQNPYHQTKKPVDEDGDEVIGRPADDSFDIIVEDTDHWKKQTHTVAETPKSKALVDQPKKQKNFFDDSDDD